MGFWASLAAKATDSFLGKTTEKAADGSLTGMEKAGSVAGNFLGGRARKRTGIGEAQDAISILNGNNEKVDIAVNSNSIIGGEPSRQRREYI